MSTADLQKAKDKADRAAWKARHDAAERIQSAAGAPFEVAKWSNSARDAYKNQWLPADRLCDWNWPEIFSSYRTFDRFEFSIWSPGKRLSGLGLATVRNSAIYAEFFEGDPRPDCALKGQRLAIFFDAVAEYGQLLGKREMQCDAINDTLAVTLEQTFGFRLETGRKGAPYYVREI